jgi:hypothetical protein
MNERLDYRLGASIAESTGEQKEEVPAGWCTTGEGMNERLIRMVSSGMLRRVALVRTDVPEEPGASYIRVTRIGELGTQAATSNRRTLRRNIKSVASCSLCCS